MNRLLVFLSRARGAGLIEYALILGLIAVVAVGSVAGMGSTTSDIFCRATSQITAEPGQEDEGLCPTDSDIPAAPHLSLSVDGPAPYGGAASLTYASDGESLSGNWRFAGGACAAYDPESNPNQALALAGLSGSHSFVWSEINAGCLIEICLEATNQTGSTPACVTLQYAARDVSPEALTFNQTFDILAPTSAVPEVDPGATVISNAAELLGFDGALTASAQGGLMSLNGGAFTGTSSVVASAPGDAQFITLRTDASNDFGATVDVELTLGDLTTSWTVTTRAQITDVVMDFADYVEGELGSVEAGSVVDTLADPLTLVDFDGPLTAEILTPGPFDLALDTGSGWSTWSKNAVVKPGDRLALRGTAASIVGAETQVEVKIGTSTGIWKILTGYPASPLVLTTPSAGTSFTVPPGVSEITVQLWGAGGGGGNGRNDPNYGGNHPAFGGGGGYATATLVVAPGETYEIVVGEGGAYRGYATTIGGGGKTGLDGASGGGRSALRLAGNDLLTAGGGGGGGYDGNGGAGGGASGEKASNAGIAIYPAGTGGNDINGGGGTQSAGGQPGINALAADNYGQAGGQYAGGAGSSAHGGGGGGGWYGGAGGNYNASAGGGGGGSSHGGSSISGSGATPGNAAGAASYSAGAGYGAGTKGTGGNGLAVITW